MQETTTCNTFYDDISLQHLATVFTICYGPGLLFRGPSCVKTIYVGSWWGNGRERDHWGDLGIDGWIILGWISRK